MHAEVRTYVAGRTSWRTCFDVPALVRAVVRHRELLVSLVGRNVAGRYRGSVLGVAWTVVQPLLLLAVYTFVFSVVFQPRWGGSTQRSAYALSVFCGMIPFNLVAESAGMAGTVVLANANYVKRVVFPLELLPVMVAGSALVGAGVNVLVLLGGHLVLAGVPPWTVLLLPVAAVPCVLLALAASWGLAALGVFVRDTPAVVLFVTQVLFFLTPVLYPVDALPEGFRTLLELNPLATIVEGWRSLVLGMGPFPAARFALVTAASAGLAVLGRAAFVRAQRGFADVV